MNNILWELPIPATGLIRGPHFEVLPKRQCKISFSIEADNGSERPLALLFDEVEAYRCTFLASLGSVDQKLRIESYGKLISIKDSNWLNEVSESHKKYHEQMPLKQTKLQHFMINFDDGPCYEIICNTFRCI